MTKLSTPLKSKPAIISLPAELIESVLILSASSGYFSSISSLAQTCKHFYILIYHPSDQHLWRQIFLTTFDDPRPVMRHLKSAGPSGPSDNLHTFSVPFDWAHEFIQRMIAAKIISHSASTQHCLSEQTGSFTPALKSIISVILTSAPFPSSEWLADLTDLTKPLVFPAIILIRSFPTLPVAFESHNSSWLDDTLRNGYPPSLTRRLLAPAPARVKRQSNRSSENTAHPRLSETSEEMRLFHKLVFLRSFIPMSTSSNNLENPLSPEAQLSAARCLARRRVYNLSYLSESRAWGPFLRISEPSDSTDDNLQSLRRALAGFEDGNDSSDGEYLPGSPGSSPVPATSTRTSSSLTSAVHLMHPDYAFLSAARIVIEANLREMLGMPPWNGITLLRVVEALGALECVRMGGAPGFWERAWKGSEGVEGWDWAGVSGDWKRCVCWLDYRDLLLHNLGSMGFDDPDLQETIRFFPLTLRVTHYSRSAPVDPAYADSLVYKLPVIHVEGEARGSDLDEDIVRRVRGTVRMIGDGDVWWSLTSSHADDENEAEWVTEGVQVGALGSAVGVMGMWTGAGHVRTDSLGPWWAWKIR